MALWAIKRRMVYGGIVSVFVLFFIFVIFLNVFYQAPTCYDSVKNGDETGVDCGGSCDILCTNDALDPIVLWAKTFSISGDVYNAVAYVENPNINSENQKATYQFKIYDSDNRLITTKQGETSIPKNKKFAVFETGIILKNAKPKTTDFEFTSFGPWQKDITREPGVSLEYSTITSTSTTPTLTGKIYNKSLQDIPEIELVVLVSDSRGNTIATSRTYADNLARNSSQDFVFTWPQPFGEDISVINIIYRFVNP